MADAHSLVNAFVLKLMRRETDKLIAKSTAELLRKIISQNQTAVLIAAVKSVGDQIIPVKRTEIAVGNVVRRVLHIIREAGRSLSTAAVHETYMPQPSTGFHVSSFGAADQARSKKLKHSVFKGVNELIQEISTYHEHIAKQAVEHIRHKEVVLTFGSSYTVMEFLCAAKKKNRSFQVFVPEADPRFQGHAFSRELSDRGIQILVFTDAAVFAMMSRVNMVIVEAHAIMANGAVMGPVGLNMVALAAKMHSVPFVVLAGIHKLCPLYPQNPEIELNELRSPSELLDSGKFSDCLRSGSGTGSPLLHVVNPAFDTVSPDLVTLFITDKGSFMPSYMSRLRAEFYSADDYDTAKANLEILRA